MSTYRDEQPVPAPLITADEVYRDLAALVAEGHAKIVDTATQLCEAVNAALSDLERLLHNYTDDAEQVACCGCEEANGALVGLHEVSISKGLLPLAHHALDVLGRISQIAQQILVHSLAPSSLAGSRSVGVAAAAVEDIDAAGVASDSLPGDFVSFRPGRVTAAGDPPSPTGVTGSHPGEQ